MTKLLICRGLPASGKTTFARAWVAEDLDRRARVNRDDLRETLHGGYVEGAERRVMAVRDAAIRAMLSAGTSVVCDDTNLRRRVVRDLMRLAVLENAEVEFRDEFLAVDVEECVRRDRGRLMQGERGVSEDVIRDMHRRLVRGGDLSIPDLRPEPDEPQAAPYEPDLSLPDAFIVDLDGTLALHGTRDPYDETRVHEDRVNEPVAEVVRALFEKGLQPVYVSGRKDTCREATIAWLKAHALPWTFARDCAEDQLGHDHAPLLYMRAAGDGRHDATVKLELFDRNVRNAFRVLLVIDDRARVVRAWRSIGLTVLQCAEGDF